MGNRPRQLDLSAAMLAAVVLSACAAAAQVPVAEPADRDGTTPQRSSAVLTPPERDSSGARGARALATQDDLGRRDDHCGGGAALAGPVDAAPQFGERIAMVAMASAGPRGIDLSILHLALPPPGSR